MIATGAGASRLQALAGRGMDAAGAGAAWGLGFVRALRRDAPFHAIVAAALVAAAILQAWCGRQALAGLAWQYGCVGEELVLRVAELLAVVKVACALLRDRPRRPLAHACRVVAGLAAPQVAAGLVLFGSLALFMAAVTAVKTLLPELNPFWCDPWLTRIDRALYGGRDPWTLLQPLLGGHAATRVIEFCYGPVWASVVVLCTLRFCALHPDGPLRRRFLLTFLLAWVLCGMVAAGVFMSGGPVYHDLLVHGSPRFAALRGSLAFDAGPFSASGLQGLLWRMHVARRAGVGIGISAFPSLHVTMAMLCALAAWGVNRTAGLIGFGFALIILVGSVRLGWHYSVDGYAAAAATAALWWVAGRMVGAERRR